jgi:hypothetical protein
MRKLAIEYDALALRIDNEDAERQELIAHIEHCNALSKVTKFSKHKAILADLTQYLTRKLREAIDSLSSNHPHERGKSTPAMPPVRPRPCGPVRASDQTLTATYDLVHRHQTAVYASIVYEPVRDRGYGRS